MKRTLLAGLLAAALLAATPAAYAGTWRHTDARGDALVVDYYMDGTSTRPATDPRERRGDITRLTVRYSRSELRVATSVRERGGFDPKFRVRVVTSRGYTYDIGYSSYGGPGVAVTRNGYRYRCDGIAVTPTPAGYLTTVPGECLDFAYRVRIGAQTQVGTASDGDLNEREINDDAYRTGKVTERRPKVGPWVVAG